jgi:hypothetical protein
VTLQARAVARRLPIEARRRPPALRRRTARTPSSPPCFASRLRGTRRIARAAGAWSCRWRPAVCGSLSTPCSVRQVREPTVRSDRRRSRP